MNWKKYLTVAGGAAAAVAIAYMLIREDDNNDSKNENEEEKADSKSNKKGCKMTKEEVLQLLNEMQEAQAGMKNMVLSLIKTAKNCNYDFMTVYNEAKKIDTVDPLMKRQMVISDFDKAIESYHFDPEVSASVTKLVRADSAPISKSDRPILSVKKIIEIHAFMLKVLYSVEVTFQSIPNKKELDTKLVALVIQSIVSAKVEDTFNVLSEDVETSILAQQYALSSNVEFAQVNVEMQSIMNKCVGESFSHLCDREDEY